MRGLAPDLNPTDVVATGMPFCPTQPRTWRDVVSVLNHLTFTHPLRWVRSIHPPHPGSLILFTHPTQDSSPGEMDETGEQRAVGRANHSVIDYIPQHCLQSYMKHNNFGDSYSRASMPTTRQRVDSRHKPTKFTKGVALRPEREQNLVPTLLFFSPTPFFSSVIRPTTKYRTLKALRWPSL